MERPNVLLVILDSVRARNMGCYGYPADTTPFLDDFADNTTVYAQARSPGIHSIASHVSIFTGLEVEEHHLVDHGASLDPERTIWHTLSEAGYSTGLFTPNAVITRASNLGESFDYVEGPKRRDVPYPSALTLSDLEGESEKVKAFLRRSIHHDHPFRSLANGLSMKLGQNVSHDPEAESASVYIESFLDWIHERSEPWGACLNLMDAHYPYVPAERHNHWGNSRLEGIHDDFPDGPGIAEYLNGERPWWEVEALEALYDGCIRQLDVALERLVTSLKERDEFDDTFLVVTSDHGECFGEPMIVRPEVRSIGHRFGVSEPLTHVPLITKRPNQKNGDRVTTATSIANFSRSVESIQDHPKRAGSFISEAPVLTSTYRLRESGSLAGHLDNLTPYLGPWRALYESRNDHVLKEVVRGTDRETIHVRNAQTSFLTEGELDGDVTTAFDSLEETDVGISESRSLDSDVETHLEDLGYVR